MKTWTKKWSGSVLGLWTPRPAPHCNFTVKPRLHADLVRRSKETPGKSGPEWEKSFEYQIEDDFVSNRETWLMIRTLCISVKNRETSLGCLAGSAGGV